MIGLGRRVMTVAVAGLCLLGLGGAVSVAAATTTAGPVPAFSCGGFDHWISALAGTHFSATAALGPTTATLEGTISDVLFTRQIVSPTLRSATAIRRCGRARSMLFPVWKSDRDCPAGTGHHARQHRRPEP